jgi:transposase InsO family protein
MARHELLPDCIFHSGYGIRQSFSRAGMPGDNSWAESFFATMKKELIHWAHFETKVQARETVFEYIYSFYNVTRIQKRLSYLSPREFLRSLGTESKNISACKCLKTSSANTSLNCLQMPQWSYKLKS